MKAAKASLIFIALALVLVALAAAALYTRDMGKAYERISGRSTVIDSPLGTIEFLEGGSGTEALVIHGSGGGYDQGELVAKALLGDSFHWIAPSRMGYLKSSLPEGATFADQAQAYAHLLDHLGIDKVAVVALSQGGPSALLFAALYPERVSSLTLLSCGVASSQGAEQSAASEKGNRLVTVFSHDPLYWIASRFLRAELMGLMGANREVIATLTPQQRHLMDEVIDSMNPVEPRAAGVALDNTATMPNERIAAIRAPTLILHARDDLLQLHHNAEFAAATIRGARLKSYDRGGHLLIAVEQDDIRAETQDFIRANAGE